MRQKITSGSTELTAVTPLLNSVPSVPSLPPAVLSSSDTAAVQRWPASQEVRGLLPEETRQEVANSDRGLHFQAGPPPFGQVRKGSAPGSPGARVETRGVACAWLPTRRHRAGGSPGAGGENTARGRQRRYSRWKR